MHEIVTLQLGQRSNYLATHFWNAQEAYFTYSADQESLVDHDIHFRPGIGADGTETFTPRTVIYDLKGGFGSLRKINALYEIEEPSVSDGLWNGPAIVQRQAVIQQNPYQHSLEHGLEPPQLTTESVRYWSDFNRVYFHPKSIIQLNEYELNSTLMPFENWGVGNELFNSLDKEHDLLDRDLRPFVEEADQMQGIQLLTGVDDAWGGFGARYMDRLRDEYGKTAVWVWGVEDSIQHVPRENRSLKLSNVARSVSEIASQASLFIPITMPSKKLPNYVTIDPKSQWHVSGLLCTAMESMTLPSRLKARERVHETLDQITSVLNVNGNQNIAKLRMSVDLKSFAVLNGNGHDRPGRLEVRAQSRDMRIPSRERSADPLQITDEDDVATFDMDFFPTDAAEQPRGRQSYKKPHIFGQAEIHRDDKDHQNDRASEEDEGHERARRRAAGLPIIQKSRIPLPFPLLDSLPRIFAQDSPPSPSVSVRASLSTDTTVALRIKTLQQIASRAIGVDEREALVNSLGEIAEAYEEGWDSGSDEDDD